MTRDTGCVQLLTKVVLGLVQKKRITQIPLLWKSHSLALPAAGVSFCESCQVKASIETVRLFMLYIRTDIKAF